MVDQQQAEWHLDRLLRRQRGIATRAQLLAAGVSPARLAAQIDGGRWQRLNERAICLHNGPLTQEQSLWAVLLSASPLAALSGRTALVAFHGLKGFAAPGVQFLAPKGSRFLGVPGVAVDIHELRRLPNRDIRLVNNMRCAMPKRSVIDAATWTADPHEAARLLVAGMQHANVPPSWLRAELEVRRTARHRRLLLLLCNDLEGGAQALSEVEFLAFCRRHGFPRPTLQVRMDSGGRRRYLDASFRRADGSTFGVEVDGGIHLKLKTKARDDLKDNYAKLARRLVLRFSSYLIYTDDPEAVGQIRAALAE